VTKWHICCWFSLSC